MIFTLHKLEYFGKVQYDIVIQFYSLVIYMLHPSQLSLCPEKFMRKFQV